MQRLMNVAHVVKQPGNKQTSGLWGSLGTGTLPPCQVNYLDDVESLCVERCRGGSFSSKVDLQPSFQLSTRFIVEELWQVDVMPLAPMVSSFLFWPRANRVRPNGRLLKKPFVLHRLVALPDFFRHLVGKVLGKARMPLEH